MLIYVFNPSTQGLSEFQVSLVYTVKPCLQKTGKHGAKMLWKSSHVGPWWLRQENHELRLAWTT